MHKTFQYVCQWFGACPYFKTYNRRTLYRVWGTTTGIVTDVFTDV